MNSAAPSVSDTYWCAEPRDKFANEYFSRIGAQMLAGGLGYLGRLQWLAHRHFYGALPSLDVGPMPSSAFIARSGDQGSNFDLRVNAIRQKASSRHQLIVAPALAWTATAVNTDARSMADASTASDILEYLWKSGAYEAQAKSAVLGSILYGEEFLFTYWNPQGGKPLASDGNEIFYTGALECHTVYSWDCFRDTSAKTFEQSQWLSARLSVNRYDLIAQFPTYKAEILAAAATPAATQSGVAGQAFGASVNNDKVQCHYFFHRRTPALPLGLQAILLNSNTVLDFKPLEDCYAEPLPIHRMKMGDIKGTPWPYSDFWEAMATQGLITDIESSLATNIIAHGRQMISAESNADLPIDQIGNGPAVLYRAPGTQPPVAIQLTAQPPEAFNHLEHLDETLNKTFGLNDVALGQAPNNSKEMNAQAFALLSSAAITANSDAQSNYVGLVRNAGRSMLAIFKAKASQPQKISIIGKNAPGFAVPQSFDQKTFAGIDDINVEIGPPMAQTTAGRVELGQMFLKTGMISTPEQLEQVLATGKLEPLTQTLRNELIFIASENEAMQQGQNPPMSIYDSHQLHIREHRGVLFSAGVRQDPQIFQAVNEHIQQHMKQLLTTDPRVLGVMGQATPPPLMMNQPPDKAPAPTDDQVSATLEQPGQPSPAQKPIKAPVNPATGAQAQPPGLPQR